MIEAILTPIFFHGHAVYRAFVQGDIETLIVYFIAVMVIFFGYSLFVTFARPLIYWFEILFFWLNRILWFLINPMRFLWKNPNRKSPRGLFMLTTLSGISLAWFVLIYIVTTPIRIILALYYDVLLFLTVSVTDNIEEFISPKIGAMKYKKGLSYGFFYILTLPWRFVRFLFKSVFYLLDSFLMFGVSVVFPTLTMLHGTGFREAGTKITQSGDWKVGGGNYAGTGIYFGIDGRTAKHYAPSGSNHSIIIARVTLTFCKTIATLPKEEREMIGLGQPGEELANRVKGFYRSVEHWRELGWWEYCLLQPGKMDSFINSWRLRPVALINDAKIVRTYGGFSHYCKHIPSLVAGGLSWYVIFLFIEATASAALGGK